MLRNKVGKNQKEREREKKKGKTERREPFLEKEFESIPEGARNSPGLPPEGAGGPCPGGPVRNSGGPPPAPGGGYSPVTATAAAIPAKLAGSKPVRNRLRVLFREDRIRPPISEPGCHNYRDLPNPLRCLLYSRDTTRETSFPLSILAFEQMDRVSFTRFLRNSLRVNSR